MHKNRALFLLQILSALLFAVLSMAALTRTTAAQDMQPTPSDNEVNRVASQMYCPICENIPLDVCPTQGCHEWRELIRLKLAEGLSDEEIKEYFVLQYGDRVLAEPPRRGLNWLVYLLPPLAFLGGAGILWSVLRKAKKNSLPENKTEPAATVTEKDDYLHQVEEELKRREQD